LLATGETLIAENAERFQFSDEALENVGKILGTVYQWSSHYRLDQTAVNLFETLSTQSGAGYVQLETQSYVPAGSTTDVTIDITFDPLLLAASRGVSFSLNLPDLDGLTYQFVESDQLVNSAFNLQSTDTGTGLILSFQDTSGSSDPQTMVNDLLSLGTLTISAVTDDVVAGSVQVDVANIVVLDQFGTEIAGSDYQLGFKETSTVTNAAGEYFVDDTVISADVEFGRELSAKESGISYHNVADVISTLDISLGRSVTSGNKPVSPYQLLAADVNQDGKINIVDVLKVLDMTLLRPTAPEREWMFVREDQDFTGFDFRNIDWATLESSRYELDGSANYVGVLKGDVNGSWKDYPADAPADQFIGDDYFVSLGNPEQFWVL